jgi:hypothetical protein
MTKPANLLGYSFLLTVVSLWVVGAGAGDEPYLTFRASDAYVQIGIALVLMALWLQLAAWLVYASARRRISRPWLALIIWVALVIYFLWDSPAGYIQDISRYVAHQS